MIVGVGSGAGSPTWIVAAQAERRNGRRRRMCFMEWRVAVGWCGAIASRAISIRCRAQSKKAA